MNAIKILLALIVAFAVTTQVVACTGSTSDSSTTMGS